MIQNISDRRRGLRAAAEVCTIRPPLPRRYGKVRASERTEEDGRGIRSGNFPLTRLWLLQHCTGIKNAASRRCVVHQAAIRREHTQCRRPTQRNEETAKANGSYGACLPGVVVVVVDEDGEP